MTTWTRQTRFATTWTRRTGQSSSGGSSGGGTTTPEPDDPTVETYRLLQELADDLLLESGDYLLLENAV